MNINEFEYITVDLERNIKSLRVILDLFENKINEDYYTVLNGENKEYYNEIQAIKDILQLIETNFETLQNHYTNQINRTFSNSLF